MKKFVAIILVIALLCAMASAELYPIEGIVVGSVNGIITVEDVTGNVWDFYGDNAVEDLVLMIMEDNGTSTVIDDVVVAVIILPRRLHSIWKL